MLLFVQLNQPHRQRLLQGEQKSMQGVLAYLLLLPSIPELAPSALGSRNIASVNCPNTPATRLRSNEMKSVARSCGELLPELKIAIFAPPTFDLGLTLTESTIAGVRRTMVLLAGTPAVIPLHYVGRGRGYRAPTQRRFS